MTYNPATDFVALWRNIAGVVSKLEMPGLDLIINALARAGLFTLSVSATAPVVSQATTAWLKAAVPSYSAEGQLFLWDKVTSAYLAATPALFLQMLEAAANQNGVSWRTSVGGPPLNTVGNDGDFDIRTDMPFGIYGPKAAGAWPATPIPGTADLISSTSLDNTFGTAEGALIVRGAAVWEALPTGAPNNFLTSSGADPEWADLSDMLDIIFGNAQGSILYRDAGVWNDLAPGVATQVLQTNGPGANPSWAARTAEFTPGTVMLFQQSSAPTGWTKSVALNDYGLRVTSGAVGVTPGTAFSTVFAQTVVGDHTLTTPEIPAHHHTDNIFSAGAGTVGGGGSFGANLATVTGDTGGSGAHSHSVQLALSYVDVIIASKN